MVQHCFNPACRQEFQLLYAGDLYALEWVSADTEFFWLCSNCASRFDLCLDNDGAITLSASGAAGNTRRPLADRELHLISRCARPTPRPDSRPTAERHYSSFHGAEPHFSGYRPRVSAWQEEDAAGKHSAPTAA
jgi:hypothetical protein